MPGNPLDADWRVLIRDSTGAILDELDNWISLSARGKFNGVGAFQLEMSSDGVSARTMNESRGIVIQRNGVTKFSGQVQNEFTRTANTIRCAGPCDNYLLNRPALPDPFGPPYTTPYDTITRTHASTLLFDYVFRNLGAGARVDRRVANLILAADPAVGGSMTGRAGGESVLAVLNGISSSPISGGLGFQILQSDNAGGRTFSVYQPVDRSASVKFGVELGTAHDFEDTRSAPPYTYVYVMGGDGLGFDNRTIAEGGDATAIARWGQIETLYDARGITSPADLNVKLAELLVGATPSRVVNVSPLEVPSLQFGDHWNLGDVVTFEITVEGSPTESFVDLIREVRFDFTVDRGVIVTPMIGEAGSTNDSQTAQYISTIQDRLSNVERNWLIPDLSIIPAMLQDNAVIARTIAASAVTAAKLDAIDTPGNREVPAFESGSGRLQWLSFTELAGVTATFLNLTVTGTTILGDNVAADVLTVNAAEVHNGAAGFAGTVSIAGTATLAGVTATSLGVSGTTTSNKLAVNGTSFVGSEVLHVISGSSVLDGAVTMSSTLAVTGNTSSNKLVLNGTTFVGSEILRVISGSSILEGKVTITAGGMDVTGPLIYRSAASFTSGGVDVTGGFTVNSGGADVTGSSTFRASVTVTSGGIGVTGSSVFNSGLTVLSGFNANSGMINVSGTTLSFYGNALTAKPTVTGTRTGTLAQLQTVTANLLSALSTLGLLTDSTT